MLDEIIEEDSLQDEDPQASEDRFNELYLRESPPQDVTEELYNEPFPETDSEDTFGLTEPEAETLQDVEEETEATHTPTIEDSNERESSDDGEIEQQQREPKSIRDLRTFNEPGLKESPVEEVDKWHSRSSSPQTRFQDRRMYNRSKTRERQQSERDVVRNARRSTVDEDDLGLKVVNVFRYMMPKTERLDDVYLWSMVV